MEGHALATNQKEPSMFEKLKAKKAEIARLREERGATDPILIIAGIAITLILLVGGSFAISGFIANANNLNAKGDLDRIATAQAAYLAEKDTYAGVGRSVPGVTPVTAFTQATALNALQTSSIGFTPTANNNIALFATANGWVAMTKSASGTKYVRTSANTTITEALPAAAALTALGFDTAAQTAMTTAFGGL